MGGKWMRFGMVSALALLALVLIATHRRRPSAADLGAAYAAGFADEMREEPTL